MAGNVIEHVAPASSSLVDLVTINCLSNECLGQDITVADDGLASAAYTANLLIFVPLTTARPVVVSQFFWQNGATNDASGHVDIGIYSADGTRKLASTGSTTPSGTSQIQVVDISNVTLGENARYWLAFGCDSSTQTFWRGNPVTTLLDLLGVKQQSGGWSSELPSSASFATPSVGYLPFFGFTGGTI